MDLDAPFHGGDRGSNPRGDANSSGVRQRRAAAVASEMYGSILDNNARLICLIPVRNQHLSTASRILSIHLIVSSFAFVRCSSSIWARSSIIVVIIFIRFDETSTSFP